MSCKVAPVFCRVCAEYIPTYFRTDYDDNPRKHQLCWECFVASPYRITYKNGRPQLDTGHYYAINCFENRLSLLNELSPPPQYPNQHSELWLLWQALCFGNEGKVHLSYPAFVFATKDVAFLRYGSGEWVCRSYKGEWRTDDTQAIWLERAYMLFAEPSELSQAS